MLSVWTWTLSLCCYSIPGLTSLFSGRHGLINCALVLIHVGKKMLLWGSWVEVCLSFREATLILRALGSVFQWRLSQKLFPNLKDAFHDDHLRFVLLLPSLSFFYSSVIVAIILLVTGSLCNPHHTTFCPVIPSLNWLATGHTQGSSFLFYFGYKVNNHLKLNHFCQ